ncbi:hypothetical protein B4U79_12635 [Dinothrombium tinctorium]|uniref:Histone deacetylase domain-containing protein n=1 Tax=Dinothrombium tinctorium TaxID=1965070 RepID=A0A3S3PAF3_9ACAR|nr:hypothetical protein B4U79_12635 [Dinothrombium tinctorium]
MSATSNSAQCKVGSIKTSNHILHQFELKENNICVVFNPCYDISFYKLENIHAFDCKKWGKIARRLNDYFVQLGLKIEFLTPPHPITDEELRVVHSQSFIMKMNYCKMTVVRAAEVPLLLCIPMFLIRSKLLTPLKWQTAGTVLAGYVALKHGYAINLGGGFHHCSAESAGGFCMFADITLCIRYLWEQVNNKLKVMIVDLDAHQGNGHERDALSMPERERNRVYILDIFNGSIYPGDEWAKNGIDRMIILKSFTKDDKYLQLLQFHIEEALKEFTPDLILYNAGTDILEGDPLGALSITPEARFA